MNKIKISIGVVVLSLMSGVAYAGFDKNPTSAFEDRRVTAESNIEQVKLLKEILAESKKNNEFLKKLIDLESSKLESSGKGKVDVEPSVDGELNQDIEKGSR